MNKKLTKSGGIKMEPIILCGAVIVAFGLWIEFESIVRILVRAVCKSKILVRIMSLVSEQRPVSTNKYILYTR